MAQPAGWWPHFLPVGLWPANWPLVIRMWDGISSYGGFIGGSIGFALFVWWKPGCRRGCSPTSRSSAFAGVLDHPGRIGCTVVSDHIGAAVDPGRWYAFMAMDYPARDDRGAPQGSLPGDQIEIIPAWNLGLMELLYLIPVNLLILWLAFNPAVGADAGGAVRHPVLTGALVRAGPLSGLDFLRPEDTDPRYVGLTFAQWSSILAFGVAVYRAPRAASSGPAAPAETVAPTSREEPRRSCGSSLREDEEAQQQQQSENAGRGRERQEGRGIEKACRPSASARTPRPKPPGRQVAEIVDAAGGAASPRAGRSDNADGPMRPRPTKSTRRRRPPGRGPAGASPPAAAPKAERRQAGRRQVRPAPRARTKNPASADRAPGIRPGQAGARRAPRASARYARAASARTRRGRPRRGRSSARPGPRAAPGRARLEHAVEQRGSRSRPGRAG